jgi:hypothetical protein
MFSLFATHNPLSKVQSLRDRAERIGLHYLERQAITGKISRPMLLSFAQALNQHPDELVERIPDRRRAARYAKAMAGLRAAKLIGDRQTFADHEDR